MASRINPYRIKQHRCYTTGELALLLGVHKNSVRSWQKAGMPVMADGRPVLFQGAMARAFLTARNKARKRPCRPGTIYCFRCREPRSPALDIVEFAASERGAGDLRALCGECGTMMHRRPRRDALPTIMPGLTVQITQASPRLSGSPSPSLNCDSERQVKT
jgi:hypothetical protein